LYITADTTAGTAADTTVDTAVALLLRHFYFQIPPSRPHGSQNCSGFVPLLCWYHAGTMLIITNKPLDTTEEKFMSGCLMERAVETGICLS
jgi:hypothetical protein